MNLSRKNMKKICALILFAIIAYVVIQNPEKLMYGIRFVWGVIFPFVLGLIIAFIINIPVRFLEKTVFKKCVAKVKSDDGEIIYVKKRFVRPLSLTITFLLLIAIIAGVVLIVVPQMGSTLTELVKTAEVFWPRAQQWIKETFHDNEYITRWIGSLSIDVNSILNTSIQFFRSGAGNVLTGTFTAAKAVVSGITSFVIGLIFSFYLLAKKESLLKQTNMLMRAALPDKILERTLRILKMSNEVFSSFITGQCLEALILGVMFFVVLAVTRMPYALLISVLIAFTSLIPVFGAFIGCVIGAFLILMVSPFEAVIFVVIFLVLQQIEGNLIYPRVVGGSIGLPSLWVLAAITIGSSLMGIAGMLFFIPLTSVIYSLVKEWTYRRLKEKDKSAEGK